MPFEVDFLPVGDSNGDAITIRYGDDISGYLLHVVDGGLIKTSETIIEHIEKYYPGFFIDHMVLSHADNDHACGLVEVLKHFTVHNLWMNRPWLYATEAFEHFHGNYSVQGLVDSIKEKHPYLVELEQLAMKKGTKIHEVFQGDQIGRFTVLAPSKKRYIELLPDLDKTPNSYRSEDAAGQRNGILTLLAEVAKKWMDECWNVETLSSNPQPPTSASNEGCVVQYGELEPGKTVLLTADVGPVGLHEAADYALQLGLSRPHFIQVPHHGSRHNVTPSVLNRWLGFPLEAGDRVGIAFCSVGAKQSDYPRGQVKNAFMRRGYSVYSTRTKWISHYSGKGHLNSVAAKEEEFALKVEAP